MSCFQIGYAIPQKAAWSVHSSPSFGQGYVSQKRFSSNVGISSSELQPWLVLV